MVNQQLLEKVKKASKFEDPEDIKVFDEGVWRLAEQQDNEAFRALVELFDDETDNPEVMFSLVHALESYPDDKYISNLIGNLSTGLSKAPENYAGLFIAALNSEKCLLLVKNSLLTIKKDLLDDLTSHIEKISPRHAKLLVELGHQHLSR